MPRASTSTSASPTCATSGSTSPPRSSTARSGRSCICRVAAALRPGGRFAWNAFCFDPAIAVRLDGQHQAEPVPHTVHQKPHESRVDVELDAGDSISLWWATKNEWLGLIDVAGLEVEALYGWFDRRPFDEESREFVWVTRKPATSK
jgi:hypothetical protein